MIALLTLFDATVHGGLNLFDIMGMKMWKAVASGRSSGSSMIND
jgi:hypothetical protein